MKGTVLIVTQKLDPHADVVVGAIRRRGGDVIRLNTDDFLDEYTVSFFADTNDTYASIADRWGRRILVPDDVVSVYYRKPVPLKARVALADKSAQAFIQSEAEEFIRYIYTDERLRLINNPYAIRYAQPKYGQLRLAAQYGLRIPATLISTDPSQVRMFLDSHERVICKTLITSGAIINDAPTTFGTTEVNKMRAFAALDEVPDCPTQLQELIDKDYDVRVTIIGNSVFSCKIDSQVCKNSATDFRLVTPESIPHTQYSLPSEIENAILNMMKLYNLSFCTADFARDRNGDYVFFEINPNGQWYWIEQLTGMPIAQTMADFLLDK